MTQTPAGWYPDPDPTYAGQPGRLRYWDGAAWTEHLNVPAVPRFPSTPDGQPLAGWWLRVLALVLDGFIALPLYAIAAAPVVASQWDDLSRWFDDLQYAADYGTADPPNPALLDASQGPFWVLVGSMLLASLIYQFVFLTWKQATPGKLIVGLRVRLRERPELPVGTVVLRLLSVLLLGLCWIGQLLDYLWPLWDDKKQALHDKLAKTNVVTVRGSVSAAAPAPRW